MKKLMIMIAVALLLIGCFERDNQMVGEQSVTFQLMKSADIDVASAICVVSAEDMDTLVVTLTVTPTSVSGEIQNVPYGEDRLFEIKTYNSSGLMNYYGSTLIDINSIAPTVDITLYPVDLTADVTIVGTFADDEETEEKIAFVADWTGTYEVYIMDTDATNIIKLTSSGYNANCPIISPDRESVVYQRPSELGHQGFIVDIETQEEEMLPLVAYSPHELVWSPDGDKLVFWSNYYVQADIFEYDLNTGNVTCLVREDTARCWGAMYTPDGEHLMYFSDRSGTFKAYLANPDGSDPQLIIDNDLTEDRAPDMNPVSTNLVAFAGRGYNTTSYSQWGLFVIDMQTDTVTNVISTLGVDEKQPSWSTDGNTIMYSHFDGENYGIYTINPDGSGNKALLDTEGNERWGHWR